MICQIKRKMQIEKKKNKENLAFAHFLCWLKCAEETPTAQPKVSGPPDNSKQDLLPFPSRTREPYPFRSPLRRLTHYVKSNANCAIPG